LSRCLLLAWCCAVSAAQAPPTFPAQQRGPGDPALVARGLTLYTSFCRACHGPDLRGGDMGGPNLALAAGAERPRPASTTGPVVLAGRVPAGGGTPMPPMQLPGEDLKALAEYVHSVVFTAQPQGAPPRGAVAPLNLLVGNARAGERYFKAQCAACHSATGDLAGIGTRVPDIEQLQNSWVAGRRAGTAPGTVSPRSVVRATVKLADGAQVSGRLARLDEFIVSVVTDEGQYRSFTRRAEPRVAAVQVEDPLAQHRALWQKLGNKDMHDVTAYLASLK